MRRMGFLVLTMGLALLAGCAPSPAEQAAMDAAQRAHDQDRCGGYGFQPGTDAFAHCMMQTATQRDAQEAADRRAAAARQAANDRDAANRKAAADAADKDAWDRKTGQGIYSSSSRPASSFPSSSPVDQIRDSIQNDMDKMDRAGMISP